MKKIIFTIFIFNLLIFSTSCKKEKNIENQIKKENSIPKELIAMVENIDKTEEKLLEIKKELEKPVELEIQKEKEQMIKKIQAVKNPQENTSKVENELKTVETHREKIEKMWNSLEKLIEETHTQSNNYKIKAIEEKADSTKVQKFEEDLNNLTIYIENKDILNAFISNNNMYDDSSYFISLHNDYKAQTKALKYYINRVYIFGLKSEWSEAIKGINDLESQYSEMLKESNKEIKEKEKPTNDDKKKEKNLEKLKLSIDSLKQSLDKKDIKLLEIKRSIVVNDLEKVKE